MNENVSDFLVNRLAEWGVKRIFGFRVSLLVNSLWL